ncbi:MAG: SpoIVB peptidase [Lachnospiraceae bacterium]|nr:SpoIVB peptidase [Lachnospiraceae bacterium]
MKRKKYYRIIIGIILIFAMMILFLKAKYDIENMLPENIYMENNSNAYIESFLPISADCKSEKTDVNNVVVIKSGKNGIYKINYKLLGLISIKNATVTVTKRNEVYPMGMQIGMYLHTKGIMVIGTGEFLDSKGVEKNPSKGKIKENDYIVEFNGIKVDTKNQLVYLINENKDKEITLTVERNGKRDKVSLIPELANDMSYKLGIWVRDDMQGIGTMTYVDKNYNYGALGHGVSDIDTGRLLDSTGGKIYKARIWGVKKGKNGMPGGLCGNIDYLDENIIGNIDINTNYGIFGKALKCDVVDDKVKMVTPCKVAFKQEIRRGKAKIQIIENDKPVLYDVCIEKIIMSQKLKDKNMIIKITDKKLLKKTNGIVQGMSGSPIIQNGKIVGAITHVFVNDSKRGYGIFAEQMLEEGGTDVGKSR